MDVLPQAEEKGGGLVRTMFDRIAPSYDRMNRIITLGFDQRWRRSLMDGAGRGRRRHSSRPGLRHGRLRPHRAGAGGAGGGGSTSPARCWPPRADAAPTRSDSCAATPFACRSQPAVSPWRSRGSRCATSSRSRPCWRNWRACCVPADASGCWRWTNRRSGVLRLGHGLYFQRVVPALGALLSDGRAYRYLPASAAYLPDGEGLRGMLEEAGFTEHREAQPPRWGSAVNHGSAGVNAERALPAPGSLGAWRAAARPPTLTAAVAPVLVGTGAAIGDGVFAAGPFVAALFGGDLPASRGQLRERRLRFRAGSRHRRPARPAARHADGTAHAHTDEAGDVGGGSCWPFWRASTWLCWRAGSWS